MSRKSEFLRKRERVDITLPMLLDYYLTSKKVRGCSPKTIIALRSVLQRFIRFLEGRQHSLKLGNLTIEDGRVYVASLQGRITKYEGHTFNRPVAGAEYSPQTIHSHVRILRTFSNWLVNEGIRPSRSLSAWSFPNCRRCKSKCLPRRKFRRS